MHDFVREGVGGGEGRGQRVRAWGGRGRAWGMGGGDGRVGRAKIIIILMKQVAF